VGEPTHCPELFITVLPETATTPDVIKLPPVMLPVALRLPLTVVLVLLADPIVITVLDPATPPVPILTVFVLPDTVAPIATPKVWLAVDCPTVIAPVCAVPPTVNVPVV
jgi:hypothetical protein